MPIVGIPLAGRYFTIFNILFIVTFAFCLLKTFSKNEVNIIVKSINSRTRLLFVFFFIEVIAAFIGLFFLPQNWSRQIFSYLIKSIEYAALFLLIMCEDEDDKEVVVTSFMNGLLFGCIVNAVWGIVQAILWYIGKISLNQLLFSRAIRNEKQVGIYVNVYYGIRVSGLNTDPAHLGALLPILFYYSTRRRKTILILLCLVSLAFSGSTTALLAIAFCSFIMIFRFDCLGKKTSISSHTVLKTLLGILCVALMILSLRNTEIFLRLSGNTTGFLSRVLDVYGNASESTRGTYYLNVFNELYRRLPFAFFGTGLGTSGYAYYDFPEAAIQGVFDVESTYLSYLFDVGIVGLLVYLILLGKSFFVLRNKDDEKINILLMGVLLSIIATGISYHYIITTYQIIPLFFITLINNKTINSEKSN
ncbi:MAG: O-antigen ligase family protein [Clostridiales bacterium]|nr:O-antigen ligase family protein [Clostridiales bacterium]